jgi:hypothetical protein
MHIGSRKYWLNNSNTFIGKTLVEPSKMWLIIPIWMILSRWNVGPLICRFISWIVVFVRWFKLSGKKVIQDRTIYEDAHILPPIFYSMGLMTNRDFQNYSSLLNWWNQQLKPWFIKFHFFPLVGQIHKRGRSMNPLPSII